jgi:hypothetical protein
MSRGSVRSVDFFLQEFFQMVQSSVPKLRQLLENLLRPVKGAGIHSESVKLADLDPLQHARPFQHFQMARNGGRGDGKGPGQLGDRATGFGDAEEDLAAHGVGQGVKNAVEISGITFNHYVK